MTTETFLLQGKFDNIFALKPTLKELRKTAATDVPIWSLVFFNSGGELTIVDKWTTMKQAYPELELEELRPFMTEIRNPIQMEVLLGAMYCGFYFRLTDDMMGSYAYLQLPVMLHYDVCTGWNYPHSFIALIMGRGRDANHKNKIAAKQVDLRTVSVSARALFKLHLPLATEMIDERSTLVNRQLQMTYPAYLYLLAMQPCPPSPWSRFCCLLQRLPVELAQHVCQVKYGLRSLMRKEQFGLALAELKQSK